MNATSNVSLRVPNSTKVYRQESQLNGVADLTLYATIKKERLCMRIQRVGQLTLEQRVNGGLDLVNNLSNIVLKAYGELYRQVSNLMIGLLGDWEFDVFKLKFSVPTRDDLKILVQLEDVQIAELNTTREAFIIASGTPTVCICT